MDIDDMNYYAEYHYIEQMSNQIRQYQVAGIDVAQIDTYKAFIDKYSPKQQMDLTADAQEFANIFNAIKKDKRWQTIK